MTNIDLTKEKHKEERDSKESKNYVFGMAKSTKGENSRSLELDFVRLLLAVKTTRESGNGAVGVICVADRYYRTIFRWMNKYKSWDKIAIYTPFLNINEQKHLDDEKNDNGNFNRSNAYFGRELFERNLTEIINARFPDQESVKRKDFLYNINWDYCGVVTNGIAFERKASSMVIEYNLKLIMESISKKELQKIARETGIRGFRGMEKSQLVQIPNISKRIETLFFEDKNDIN